MKRQKKDKKASHYAGLPWEIATSPIVMNGRSAAQPYEKFLPQNVFTSSPFLQS